MSVPKNDELSRANEVSWRAALIEGSIGIADGAAAGTLIWNFRLLSFRNDGASAEQAYAQIYGHISFSRVCQQRFGRGVPNFFGLCCCAVRERSSDATGCSGRGAWGHPFTW